MTDGFGYYAQTAEIDASLNDEPDDESNDDADWLMLASSAYRTSTDYHEASLKRQWEKNMSHFRSKHAAGSKYYTDAYKHRSKIFRPKTRAIIRRHEAAAAMAYFSTSDTVHISAEDEDNPRQLVAAAITKELLNYRLDNRDVQWFKVLVGAYQETMNIGVVVSYHHWEFKEKVTKTDTGEVDEFEEPVFNEEKEIVRDRMIMQLRPPENIRIDPAADWVDPVNSSPYLIDQIPMYLFEVRDRMKEDDQKTGEAKWKEYSDGEIASAHKQDYDSLRQAREGEQRQDSKAQTTGADIHDYLIVWVHRNFIRKDGQDWVYYTLGTQFMLSEPVTIEELYFDTDRPYVMGHCIIEAHRSYPSGTNELGSQLQNETNEIANQRIDNVSLAMNKRYWVRRGADVDYLALKRNSPGSGVLMDDINSDVKEVDSKDVTSSAYNEQDRLNLDIDDVMGAFSPSTVQSNRQLNETVGGMELMSNDSNVMSEYQLRVFNETWVEPALRKSIRLIQRFETDENVFIIAAKKANIERKYGVENVDWRLLDEDVSLKADVGFGATNPQKRVERLGMAMRTVGEFLPGIMQGADVEEVVNEIFGAVGYGDGRRFFKSLRDDVDPQVQQLMEQVKQLQGIIDTKQVEQQGKVQIEDMKQRGAVHREAMKLTLQREMTSIETELEIIGKKILAEANDIKRGELELQRQALLDNQRNTEIQLLQNEREYTDGLIEKNTTEETGMDDSKAGVIQRDRYNDVPHAED